MIKRSQYSLQNYNDLSPIVGIKSLESGRNSDDHFL